MTRLLRSTPWLVLSLAALLTACDGDAEQGSEAANTTEVDNSAEVEAAYAAEPDFYRFKSMQDLPAKLIWRSEERRAMASNVPHAIVNGLRRR